MPIHEYLSRLTPGIRLRGNLFNEQVEVIAAYPAGEGIRLFAKGEKDFYERYLAPDQLSELVFVEQDTFSGNAAKFRLAVEAMRLGLAYEYDPYFSLSIARVDPLPHQLEAVYDYFLKMPRIRFLLADDPGAGKTIMAGLLIKELKIRGLVKRILIVTPANLTFQWQREMKDRFREDFTVIRGDILRANYGSNPWRENNQVITSVSWVSLQDDANQSLLRANWDLVIVDEAHKMSAQDDEHKTYAYKLGEDLSERTDHFLLMTATPHKGDHKQFQLFLRLLDKDVYADVVSLEKAVQNREAPFYLRRVKEALVTFPDSDGTAKSLFTRRIVSTIGFSIQGDEQEFYDELTRFVEDQSYRVRSDNSPRGRAVGFTMAMLQRRFASSIYAVRRSLERMRDKRALILKDPAAWRQQQIDRKLPDNFDELPDEEQQSVLEELEASVISHDPDDLRREIAELERLVGQAKSLEARNVESKIRQLRQLLSEQGVFSNPKMRMLIFTEHKDTLDYLAGDGRDGRPAGKLQEWGLTVTQIHGGMKIGDRNTPGTRIYAEREFREGAQLLVATEAAGEGINLQFCWLLINYDIPWNPIRLEQRMGRIHRYGQDKDCLIFNFVATNTREGRVMEKLFERIASIEKDIDPQQTGKVFNVLGDVFPSNQLEKMLRDMYARNYHSEQPILDRIVKEVDTERFRQITESTLEGLAKRELNLSAIVGKSEEAKERRLVPEVVQDFFVQAAPHLGFTLRETGKSSRTYQIGKVPRQLWQRGETLEPRFGMLGREYGKVAFDQELVKKENTLEWLTPGHPLFETVREETLDRFREHLEKGAVFYNISSESPARLDLFSASIVDGRNRVLHRKLFVLETGMNGSLSLKQPTIFLDIVPANEAVELPDSIEMPSKSDLEQHLISTALNDYLAEVSAERRKETEVVERHLELSLNELIHKQNLKLGEYIEAMQSGDNTPNLAANIAQAENRIEELYNRLENRRSELAKERNCIIAPPQHLGSAWVLPHPERHQPEIRDMAENAEIERLAVEAVTRYEESRGWQVQSVESENRGFDLISRKPHRHDPQTFTEVRFIEVKGRADVGEVALTSNEYRTAQRLRQDYFLYVVYNCRTQPEIHIVQEPAQMRWEPVLKVEHFRTTRQEILKHEWHPPAEPDAERMAWLKASASTLGQAYGDDEPDYDESDLKSRNPKFDPDFYDHD